MEPLALEHLPFFVYGTLLPGQQNDYLWGEGKLSCEEAVFVNGQLHDMGNCPMLVESRGNSVKGMLITVARSAYVESLSRLDALEGFMPHNPEDSAYRRVKREVLTSAGLTLAAWLYVGKKADVQHMPVIRNGDWISYVAGLQEEFGMAAGSHHDPGR